MRDKRKTRTGWRKWALRGAWIAGGAAVILLSLRLLLFPPYKQTAVTGNLTVETQEFSWVDESRVETFADTGEKRALTVKFWYPKEQGSYPLAVFSHGAFGVIDSNYSTCMELASNGYVAVSIAHPYHAMYVKDVNGRVTTVDTDFLKSVLDINDTQESDEERVYELGREWMALRTADENFVLDTILEKAGRGEAAPFSLIDTERIGLFGHSMGGASSVALGRTRDDIGAVVDLEGTMLGAYVGFEDGTEIFNEEPYPVPLLDVASRKVFEEAEELPGKGYVNFYVQKNAPVCKTVIFEGAGHLNFTDLPLFSPILARLLGVGEVDARECIEDVNHVVLNWFDHWLKGKELDLKDCYGQGDGR